MSNTVARNKKYLDSLIEQIKPIPRAAALEVASEVFTKMMDASTRDQGFDSGQAAANWRFEPYLGSATAERPEMMWGYNDVSPVAPVGYKSWYSDEDNWGLANQADVYMYMLDYMVVQMATAPEVITGVMVYNPISPGAFGAFAPGSDANYEENALEYNKTILTATLTEAVSAAELKLRAQFEALR